MSGGNGNVAESLPEGEGGRVLQHPIAESTFALERQFAPHPIARRTKRQKRLKDLEEQRGQQTKHGQSLKRANQKLHV